MNKRSLFPQLAMAALASMTIGSIAQGDFDLSWRTVDGGGATSAGGTFSLTGTIAQPDASPSTLAGGAFALAGGFWPGAGGISVPTCPADVSPAGGNGLVNIDDLLAVINGWGACPPSCPADINHSGAVDIDDLLAVVGAWGACP